MKSVIPGANVKIFGRAIHSLSKIGEELYLEPLEHGLALRTVNSSRSAYACFVFAPAFFLHYDDGGSDRPPVVDDDGDDVLRCKIGMKSCLTVFKSLSTLEKTVDKCKIHINMEDARLVFQLYCRHGIVKTYNLTFIESETLQAVFSKDLTPNVLTAQSRLLCDTVMNFQTTQEEISLIVNPEEVCIKNYIDDEPDPNKVIRTQMNLVPEEFDSFQVGVDTEVTFCLKELRAILAFSESANMPVSVHFESPGKPIVFCLDSDPSFEANFVLATLADSNTQVSVSQQSTQQSSYRNASASIRDVSARNKSSKKRQYSDEYDTASKRREVDHTHNGHSSSMLPQPSAREQKSRSQRTKNSEKLQAVLDDLLNDTDTNGAGDSAAVETVAKEIRSSEVDADRMDCNDADDSPVIPIQTENFKSNAADESGYIEVTEKDVEDDEVPGTPPRSTTQFKSVFFGMSQSSVTGSQSQKLDKTTSGLMVLAEDTDEDD